MVLGSFFGGLRVCSRGARPPCFLKVSSSPLLWLEVASVDLYRVGSRGSACEHRPPWVAPGWRTDQPVCLVCVSRHLRKEPYLCRFTSRHNAPRHHHVSSQVSPSFLTTFRTILPVLVPLFTPRIGDLF